MEFLASLQTYILALPPGAKLAAILLTGFLGGVVLNVMPCVLPVLSLKVYDVVEKAKVDPRINRQHGIAYVIGILLFYLPVGVVVGVTKASANTMFQHAALNAGLCMLLFALGLNALGVFEITVSVSGGNQGDGFRASAFKGLLAAVMSIPCSAPMLGIALGVAVAADTSAFQTVLIYVMVGLGLAFPFLVISFVPRLARAMPKPGAWMDTFKKLMGFSLMAAAVWLFGVLRAQVSSESAQLFLYFAVLVAVLLWAQEKFGGFEHTTQRRVAIKGGAAVWIIAGFFGVHSMFEPPAKPLAAYVPPPIADDGTATGSTSNAASCPPVVVDDKIAWAPFSPDAVKATLASNRPVFVDFTADWCINCKSNEKAFIEVDSIRSKLTDTNILPMKADFTNEDEVIEKWYKDLGRGGIPVYVIYLPDGKNILLPETITSEMLSKALDDAAAQFPKGKFKACAANTSAQPKADATG